MLRASKRGQQRSGISDTLIPAINIKSYAFIRSLWRKIVVVLNVINTMLQS